MSSDSTMDSPKPSKLSPAGTSSEMTETSNDTQEDTDMVELEETWITPVDRKIAQVDALLCKYADHRLQTDLLVLVLETMRKREMLTDMTFLLDDTSDQLSAHRLVLSAASAYCRNLFQKEKQPNVKVVLPRGVSLDSMNRLLDFIYTGDLVLPKTIPQIEEIMRAAQFLELQHFNQAVNEVLPKTLSFDNFRQIWNLGEDFQNEHLVRSVVNFVGKDLQTLANHKELKEVAVGQMVQLLSCPTLARRPHKDVVEAVLSWVHRNPKARMIELETQLLPHLHFDRLPLPYLKTLVQLETLIKKCPRLRESMTSAITNMGTLPDNSRPASNKQSAEAIEGGNSAGSSLPALPAVTNRTVTLEVDLLDSGCNSEDEINISVAAAPNSPVKLNLSNPHRPTGSAPGCSCKGGDNKEQTILVFGRRRTGTLALQHCSLPTNTWSQVLDLTCSLAENAAVTVHGRHVYLAGGNTWTQDVLDCFIVYNIQLRTLHKLSPMTWARSLASAATVTWFVYVVGGVQTGLEVTNKAERYDIFSEKWDTIEPLPYNASNISVGAVGVKLYCFGGSFKCDHCDNNCCMEWTNECCSYDHELNQWTLIGLLKDELMNSTLILCFNAGVFFISKQHNPEEMWTFAPSSGRWKCHSSKWEKAHLFQFLLCLLPHDDKIWAIDSGGKMFVYDVSSRGWVDEPSYSHSIPFPLYAVVVERPEEESEGNKTTTH